MKASSAASGHPAFDHRRERQRDHAPQQAHREREVLAEASRGSGPEREADGRREQVDRDHQAGALLGAERVAEDVERERLVDRRAADRERRAGDDDAERAQPQGRAQVGEQAAQARALGLRGQRRLARAEERDHAADQHHAGEQRADGRVRLASAAHRERDADEGAAAEQQADVVEHRTQRDHAGTLGVVGAELGAEREVRRGVEAEEDVEQEERADEVQEDLVGLRGGRAPDRREAHRERQDHHPEVRPPAAEARPRAIGEPPGERVVDAVPDPAERDRGADQRRREQGDVGVEREQHRVEGSHADAHHELARAVQQLAAEAERGCLESRAVGRRDGPGGLQRRRDGGGAGVLHVEGQLSGSRARGQAVRPDRSESAPEPRPPGVATAADSMASPAPPRAREPQASAERSDPGGGPAASPR